MKKSKPSIKPTSIFFARGVACLVGIAAILVCIILLPELAREAIVDDPLNAHLTYSFLAAAYILTIPFFVALYQTLRLLHFIDKNKAFTNQSIKALQNIKICAVVFAIMVVGIVFYGMILAKSVDSKEDVTFMVPLGLIFTLIPSTIAVFVAILQKLLTDAITLKSENDLIV